MKYEVWHNILWSTYKAAVFSSLGEECQDRGIDFRVYQIAATTHDRIGLSSVDLTVHRYPMIQLFAGSYGAIPLHSLIWQLGKRAATTQADIVLLPGYHRPEYWVQSFILLLRRRKQAVFCDSTALDQPNLWWKRGLKRIFFAMCPYAFCYGSRAVAYVCDLGVKPQNAFCRCQAAGLPANYDEAKVPALRMASAATVEAPLFLYVGTLTKGKRIDTILRAFSRTLQAIPASRLRLVGAGPEEAALRALAGQLGCADAVEWTGGQSGEALYANFQDATCLVLASYSEAWGLVVNEALHYGCPVIVSDRCGCVPELAEDSSCGMSFPCDDVGALTDCMVRAPSTWADIGLVAEQCLSRIAIYTPRNAALAIISGAQTILNDPGPRPA